MFDFNFSIYGFMLFWCLFFNALVILTTYDRYSFNRDEIIGALLYENIGFALGGKIMYFLFNPEPFSMKIFTNGGFYAYGCFIGMMLCLLLFCLEFKKSIKDMLLMFVTPVPLMYAINKIGCFLNGCCYGINYTGPFSIVYKYSSNAPLGVILFPIQLLDFLSFFSVFIYMYINTLRNKFDFKTLGISFIACGVYKFFLEFLRASHVGFFITSYQLISIGLVIAGIIMIWYQKRLDSKMIKKSKLAR